MISLTDTQSKRCWAPEFGPRPASAPPRNEWSERGVGRRPAGGRREPRREPTCPGQVAPLLSPGDTALGSAEPPADKVSGEAGMGPVCPHWAPAWTAVIAAAVTQYSYHPTQNPLATTSVFCPFKFQPSLLIFKSLCAQLEH